MTFLDDDPSDWSKSFKELQAIDSLLRCSICFEYFETTVVVPNCSHNYCSLCIRKHVAQKKCCPTCDKPLHDVDLKPNRVLDELVRNFKSVRLKLLKGIKEGINFNEISSTSNNPLQSDIEQTHSQESVFEASPKFRAPKNRIKKLGFQKCQEPTLEASKQNNDMTSETVSCPVCMASIPFQSINSHVDVCLLKQDSTTKTNSKRKCSLSTQPSNENLNIKKRKKNDQMRNYNDSSSSYTEMTAGSSSSSPKQAANDFIEQSTSNSMKRLPKPCFEAMSDKQLRAKAKSFGLQRKGDKKALIRRLKEYVLLHNSQCDSTNPISPNSLVKKVEENERILSSYKPSHVVHTHDHRHTDQDKEEFAKAHAAKYSRQYDDLIEQVKSRQGYKNERIKTECLDENEVLFDGDAEEYVFEIRVDSDDGNDDGGTGKKTNTNANRAEVSSIEIKQSSSQKSNSSVSSMHKGDVQKKKKISKKSKDTSKINMKSIDSFFAKKKNATSCDVVIISDQAESGSPESRIIESPSLITDEYSTDEELTSPSKHISSPRWRDQSVLNSTTITRSCVSSTPSKGSPFRIKDSSRRRLSLQKEKLKSVRNRDSLMDTSFEESNSTTKEIDDAHSPSLFDDPDVERTVSDDHTGRLSSVSEEINYLVDQLDDRSSGSSTDIEEIVPRPPSNLDFTEVDSQRFDLF